MFVKPEKPFLVILEAPDGEQIVRWFETESDAKDGIKDYKVSFPDVNFILDTFIEIQGERDLMSN